MRTRKNRSTLPTHFYSDRLTVCRLLAAAWMMWSAAPGLAQEWAVKAGGAGNDLANAIARDSAGNLYLSGPFEGTATFGSGSDSVMLTAPAGPTPSSPNTIRRVN